MSAKLPTQHGWVIKTVGGKGNFEVLFPDGSVKRVRLKKSLTVHWKKDPRRLTIGRVVLVESAEIPPGLVVAILTPEAAEKYGPPPAPVEQQLVLI